MNTEEKKRVLQKAADDLALYIQKDNQRAMAESLCDGLDPPDLQDFELCNQLLMIATDIK